MRELSGVYKTRSTKEFDPFVSMTVGLQSFNL